MPTTIVLSFNKPLEPAARRLENFRITGQKGARMSIRSAVYDPTAHTITLHPSERLSIHHPYKLIISGTGAGTGGDGFERRARRPAHGRAGKRLHDQADLEATGPPVVVSPGQGCGVGARTNCGGTRRVSQSVNPLIMGWA